MRLKCVRLNRMLCESTLERTLYKCLHPVSIAARGTKPSVWTVSIMSLTLEGTYRPELLTGYQTPIGMDEKKTSHVRYRTYMFFMFITATQFPSMSHNV